MRKEIIIDLNELDGYLRKIDSIFPLDDIMHQKIDRESIINYYRKSSAVYKYIHSYRGAVHLALNYNGIFSKKGFLTQLNEIAGLIETSKVNNVLELGCGKGFNSILLAGKFPEIGFSGIDITDEHLAIAESRSQGVKNLKFTYGDFNRLDFEAASFDLIFELESICHADDSRRVLSEICRVLKKGGQFVLFDGFRQAGFKSLPGNLKRAAILAEKSLAVNGVDRIDVWLKTAAEAGFKLKIIADLSDAVLPNLARLQLLARKFFDHPFLARIHLKIFPQNALMNCIAVLLMPFTVFNKAHGYYKIVLEK